jgi:hypothetical protein
MNVAALSPEHEQPVEAIAARVVEMLSLPQQEVKPDRLVSAAELAVELGVARSFVYEHADELGAVRLGTDSLPAARADRTCRNAARGAQSSNYAAPAAFGSAL